jgi:hypothetical protein
LPIKKWAAAAALAAAAFYLLLSGCDVATQRSFFMTAVVLIAVMVDRLAATIRARKPRTLISFFEVKTRISLTGAIARPKVPHRQGFQKCS